MRGLPSLQVCNFQSCDLDRYSGIVIPPLLTSLDFGANNFTRPAHVDRFLKDFVNDGSYTLTDRDHDIVIDLGGTGMPNGTDSASYNAISSWLNLGSITVNGL